MNAWMAAVLGALVGAGVTAWVMSGGAPVPGAPPAARAPARAALEPPPDRTAATPAQPGEQPPAEPSPAPEAVATPGPPPPKEPPGPARAGSDAPPPAAQTLSPDAASPELAQARQDLAAAQQRAETCEDQLARLDTRVFDLPPETLARLAERCELRWDLQPPRLDGPAGLPPEAAAEVGLDEAELAAIGEVTGAYNDRMLTALQALYTEVTGDDQVANLAPDSLHSEIADKAGPDELKRAFQRLSAERAGLLQPPSDPAAGPPVERLYRLLTTAGNDLEAALAERIGPEKARALRELKGGWGSRSRSSHGCPEGP